MGGYIIAAIMIGPVKGTTTCYGLLCWRWPLLVEWVMLVPFCIAVHFVPAKHLVMRIGKEAGKPSHKLSPLHLQEESYGHVSADDEALVLRIYSPPNPRTVCFLSPSPLSVLC